MHFCCRKGHLPVINYLLKASASVEAVSKGSLWTPLHAACYYGHTDAAETLLFHGAEVNLRCSVRAHHGIFMCVVLLIVVPWWLQAKLTPLDYARLQNHSELVDLLVETFAAESGEGFTAAFEEKKNAAAPVAASPLSSHATTMTVGGGSSGAARLGHPSGVSLIATTSPAPRR